MFAVLVERVHQIAVDATHGAVIACDVVGPYGVLLLQEGVGLLKLHEEQGEQLLEAGMSLRDEESFMSDNSAKGSILTLDWPSLEQVCITLWITRTIPRQVNRYNFNDGNFVDPLIPSNIHYNC